METNRDELSRIKEVLKQNPRGMNVIEIAQAIDMHRQSVTKYVEMLVVSGQVEMKAFGPSKVYYLSQRLPISAMLSLSSDMILLIDRDLKIINVNDAFLSFVGAKREDVLNKEMGLVSLSLEFDPPLEPYIRDALSGKESRIEALFSKKGRELYYVIKCIPVVFDDGRPGATVLFENVSDQKKAAQENERLFLRLKESEQRFRILIQNLKSGVVLVESDGKFTIYNPSFLQMFGLTAKDMETMKITDKAWNALEVFDSDGHPLPREERPSIRAFATGQPIKDMLIGFRRKGDGGISWVLTNIAILKAPGGSVEKLICTYYDITDRKLHEERVARLSRLYATLYRVNEAIVRIHDEAALFSEVCQIVVEESGLPLVWIGKVQGQQIVPVAGCGRAAEYLGKIRVEVGGELGRGPTGTCVRESRAIVNEDFMVNPSMSPWREQAQIYGFRGSAAFPIYRKGQIFGAFTLYAGEPHAFDDEEVRLLESLSADFSNALDALDNEQSRVRTERELRESEEKLNAVLDMLPVGISVINRDRDVIRTNPALNAILGIDRDGFNGRAYERRRYLKPDGSEMLLGDMPTVLAQQGHKPVLNAEVGIVKEDGTTVWTEVSAVPLPYADWSLVVATSDVTAKKAAEEEIRKQASLIDLSPDAIIVRERDGTITFWSQSAAILYGYTALEAIGKESHALLKTQFPGPLDEISQVLREKGSWTGELVHTAKDGRQVIVQSSWRARCRLPDNEIEIMESNVDITSRKLMEDELLRAKAQAELYLDLIRHDIANVHQIALAQLETAREIVAEKGRLEGEDLGLIESAIAALLRSNRQISDPGRKDN